MKRHGNLFARIVDMDNLVLAHHKARRGKAHYSEVQQVNAHEAELLGKLQQALVNKTFTTSSYKVKTVYDPKKRLVYVLPYYPDRIVHHAIMNVIQPIWDKIFIYDLYSAIPGKGIHKAIERLSCFLRDRENTRYCLQFDVKSYYPSMSHDILLQLIKRKIKCINTLWLLEDIIRSVKGTRGIPIGNYLSQYFGNIYLNWLDHWLKEEQRLKYYIRYNDDGVILHSDKAFLHALRQDIEDYLWDNLGLELNQKTQIYPVDVRGIDFLGYRTFRHYRLLRKSSAKRFKRRIRYIKTHHEHMTPQTIVCSIMSYAGWLQHGNCYNLTQKWLLNETIMSIMDMYCQGLGFCNPLRRKFNINGGNRP